MEQVWRRNRAVSIALVGALVLLVSACGSSSSSSAPSATKVTVHKGAPNTLNWWANWGDVWPDSLDPAVGTNTLAIDTEYLVDANLVKFSYPSLKIVGDVASKWMVTNGGKVYTFTIRPNAKFSNGDAVTAQDAAWSITRALLPATKSPIATTYLGHIVGAADVAAGKAKTLAGVKVVGPKTIQITLDQPIVFFLGSLAYNTGDVLDKKVMQGKPAGTYLTNSCSGNVGAGPFKFVCRNNSTSRTSFYPSGHSPYMDMVPNPNYYGAKPTIKIHAPTFATSDALFRAFQAGELDGSTLPSSDLTVAKSMKGFINVPQFETDYITPNSQIAPFNNVHCRLAVAYAIDRENITRKLLRNTYSPIYDILPPGILGYVGKLPGFPFYDPTRAKKELSQCPGGLKNVTMTVQNASTDVIHEYDAIRANLQNIGANVTMKPLNFNAWLKVVTQNMNATKDQETITENLWIDDYPDPQDWLTNLLHSNANNNIGGFKNPQFDSLVDRADVESNPAQRAKLYTEAQKIALSGGYWIAVGAVNGLYVISPRVHGLIASNGWTWPVNNDWSKVTITNT
jgi:oligopeptide transport system substrate-binding protein